MPAVYRRRRRDGTKAENYTAAIWIDGRKFLRALRATTAREARREAAAAEAQLRAELKRRHRPHTIDTAARQYWDDHAAKLASGARSVKYLLRTLVVGLGPDLLLAELSNADVHSYVLAREKQGVSRATINRELDVLQSIYTMARDRWEHPVRPIKWSDHRFPKDERPPAVWTIEEARAALALLAGRSQDAADAVELSIYTGMRRNELATLTPARVNLAERYATVLAKRKARQGYRERRVYLNTPAVALLAERLTPGLDPQQPIFRLINLRRLWDRVRREIGRPDVRWHDLRHTHGTMLGRSTRDPRLVQKSLGHTHLQTSMIYVHTDHAAVVEAVETIPALSSRKVVGL